MNYFKNKFCNVFFPAICMTIGIDMVVHAHLQESVIVSLSLMTLGLVDVMIAFDLFQDNEKN